MPRRTTELSDWFEHSVDTATRTLYLGGPIDTATAEFAIKGLHFLDRAEGPIFIKLASWGGEWAEGMGIYDAIRTCRNEVTATVYGMAGSMGGIILQAADTRRMTPSSVFMLHYGTEELPEDHAMNITAQAKWNAHLCIVMEDLFLLRMNEKAKITRTQFRKRFAFDTYLTPEETVAMGLADEVWGLS